MQSDLTISQIDFYRENGYLVIESFLDTAAELGDWRQCFDAAVAERLKSNVEFMTNQRDPKHHFARTSIQVLQLWQTHAGMKRLLHDKQLGKMAATLAGVDGVRIFHDQVLIKPPHGNPTAWHLDAPYWSFNSRDALSLWLALDDATLQNGAMCYLPGTHRSASLEKNVRGVVNVGELFNLYPDWKTIEPMHCPCLAGTLIWHNGLTAHAAGANLTTQPRRAMTCIFMPDGVTFNGKRNATLPEDYIQTLKVGDVLNDWRHHPLTWYRNMAD